MAADRHGASATADRRSTSRAAPAKGSQRLGQLGCAPAGDRLPASPTPLNEKAADSEPRDGDGISVVVTVRDEADQLADLLDALKGQTRAPDEVVIVEGGTSGVTAELVSDWRDRGLPVRLIEAPGVNISRGRNVGIESAANEWIACTDAGCRPLADWLAQVDRARAESEFIGGIWIARGETPFEQAVAVALHPDPSEIDNTPGWVKLSHALFGRRYALGRSTGRSMAFTKRAWRAVGGFPEQLYAGEDVSFSRAMGREGIAGRLVPEAAVLWRPHPTLRGTARAYVRYARGDVRGGLLARHVIRALALVVAPWLLLRGGRGTRLLVLLAAAAYFALPVRRARAAGMAAHEYLWLIPGVVLVRDVATTIGAAQGIAD